MERLWCSTLNPLRWIFMTWNFGAKFIWNEPISERRFRDGPISAGLLPPDYVDDTNHQSRCVKTRTSSFRRLTRPPSLGGGDFHLVRRAPTDGADGRNDFFPLFSASWFLRGAFVQLARSRRQVTMSTWNSSFKKKIKCYVIKSHRGDLFEMKSFQANHILLRPKKEAKFSRLTQLACGT